MNPLEERLNSLETRVTRYRNFNVLLCLLLVTVVTVAARDGVSPFQAKSTHESVAIPQGDFDVPNLPDGNIPDVMYPEAQGAGKIAAQTQGVIRATGLQIVNGDGQAVVELWPSTLGGGLIFVNSAEEKNLVYIGSSTEGDGRVSIRNRNEETLMRLNTDESAGWIRINKTGNENLVFLGESTSGNGLLSLSNKSGKGLVAMFADETAGRLELSNKDDKRIAYLGTDIGGEGLLRINSKTGTELITAGSNTADNGLIRVSNRYGTLGVVLIAGNEHGYVGIQNAQERRLAEFSVAVGGNGLVRTLSPQGITTWSSASVQGNTGTTSLRGDMDNDGDIDGDDFLIFSENFGKKR